MFDMTKIGKKISQLRKQNGLTQMELADKLAISYQAVSNWERGATMPDISKLPELADIFGVTIEEILCDERKGRIVEEIAKGEDLTDVKTEDLADIAPIINREQFKQAYEHADTDCEQLDFNMLMGLAPFLDEDVLNDLVKNRSAYGFTAEQLCALLRRKRFGRYCRQFKRRQRRLRRVKRDCSLYERKGSRTFGAKACSRRLFVRRTCGYSLPHGRKGPCGHSGKARRRNEGYFRPCRARTLYGRTRPNAHCR